MANNFSSDPSCKALWCFEQNLLDGKGGNHLTAQGSQWYSPDYKKEGAYSDWFAGPWANIADALLDAGFPLKSGDTSKKISVCLWMRPDTTGQGAYYFAKYDTNAKRSFAIVNTPGHLGLYVGYNNGNSAQIIDTGISIPINIFYHVGVVVDGIAKTVYVKVYNSNTGQVYTYNGSLSNELNVSSAAVSVGARADGQYAAYGYIDELVVFNRLITADEIDLIRQGLYWLNAPPYSCKSITTCEDIPDYLDNCLSLTTCEEITLSKPGDCRSLTRCSNLAGSNPESSISLAKSQGTPLTRAGLFLTF